MIEVSRSELRRIVVAIDPAVTTGEDSDETGIVVVARGPCQETCKITNICPGHGYVLADESGRYPPHEWARKAVNLFDRWGADRIVAEVNNGGDMVGETIHASRAGISYETVRASRGKYTRAEPASALYEQGRVHHVGAFPTLEDQLTNWVPDGDFMDDRLDALVWGLTALKLIGGQGNAFLTFWRKAAADDAPPAQRKKVAGERLSAIKAKVAMKQCKHRWRTVGPMTYCVLCPAVKEQELVT